MFSGSLRVSSKSNISYLYKFRSSGITNRARGAHAAAVGRWRRAGQAAQDEIARLRDALTRAEHEPDRMAGAIHLLRHDTSRASGQLQRSLDVRVGRRDGRRSVRLAWHLANTDGMPQMKSATRSRGNAGARQTLLLRPEGHVLMSRASRPSPRSDTISPLLNEVPLRLGWTEPLVPVLSQVGIVFEGDEQLLAFPLGYCGRGA